MSGITTIRSDCVSQNETLPCGFFIDINTSKFYNYSIAGGFLMGPSKSKLHNTFGALVAIAVLLTAVPTGAVELLAQITHNDILIFAVVAALDGTIAYSAGRSLLLFR